MTSDAVSADLERLRLVVEKERADPDGILGGTYNEGWDDALCWVLDEIHRLEATGFVVAPAPAPYWWDGSPTRPPTAEEVQQFDGGDRAD